MLSSAKMLGRVARAVATRDPDRRVRRFYQLTDPKKQFANRATRYINIGYWPSGATTVDQAGDAIAEMMAERARFAPGQDILDVGCGYGDQDFLWLRQNEPREIQALDVTPHQIEGARERAEAEGVDDRLHFRVGTATELPFEDASFDRVVALDAALHFNTRDDFLREALRVLRPGGVLGIVDTIPLDSSTPVKGFRSPKFELYRFTVPEVNWYSRDVYAQRLTAAGFTAGTVTSIRDRTWEPWYRYWSGLAHSPDARSGLGPAAAEKLAHDWRDPELIRRELDLLDSVVAVAEKPGGAGA